MQCLKRFQRIAFIILLTALSPAANAQTESTEAAEPGSAAAVKQETRDLVATLRAYGAHQRVEAIQATQNALEDIDRGIDDLQKRMDENWGSMGDEARANAQSSMQALREQRTTVGEWFNKLQTSSAEAWDEVKEGLSDAYEAMGNAWNDAISRVGAGS